MPASSLVDVVDSLLNKGTVVLGETSISLAGVDLVHLQLQLMLSSTANLVNGVRTPSPASPNLGWSSTGASGPLPSGPPSYEGEVRGGSEAGPPDSLVFHDVPPQTSSDVAPTDESPEKGIARLALTVVELLRQTVERQAIRRVEAGGLPDDDVERMGVALMELEGKMAQLRELFGLTEEETNVDLGPIGKVL